MPRMATIAKIIAFSCIFFFSLKCGEGSDNAKKANEGQSRYFLDRISMKLRNGKIINDDEYERYKSEELGSVISSMMKDEDFVDTVFDFNLYFLGFKSPNLKFPAGKAREIFSGHKGKFSNAITSALEVAKDGDYLSLFDFKQPIYAEPLVTGKATFGDGDVNIDLSRSRASTLLRKKMGRLKELFSTPSEIDRDSFCTGEGFSELSNHFRRLHTQAAGDFFYQGIGEPKLFALINRHCLSEDETLALSDAERQKILSLIGPTLAYMDYLLAMTPENYQVRSVRDFKILDTTPLEITEAGKHVASASWFWMGLANSSTNFNRKRASYVLKRFMCDDLTPVAVELPKEHTGGKKHASDPSCMSCHYKLDPIGGFFREYGYRGIRFPDQGLTDSENPAMIYFDDNAAKTIEEYVAEWKSPVTGRLELGVIRSTTDRKMNVYPAKDDTGPEALFAMLRDLPEARQCLVKNAIRYLVDDTLTVDNGYIRYLTDRFNKNAEENSSRALRELFSDILRSKAFARRSVEEGVCYDYAPGVNPNQRPPCQIADVIERNCVSCHAGAGAQGGLDLREWSELGDGFGFVHLASGKQLSRDESFSRIANALSTSDDKKRMPLNTFMDPQDRELLYKFFNTAK